MTRHSVFLRIAAGVFLTLVAVPIHSVIGQSGQTSYTVWPATATPALIAADDAQSVELGVKFRADVSGFVTGLRFYKATTNTGAHVGNLWTRTGTKLAAATFQNETAAGWQQANFATPVAIAAGTVYVASYHTNTGRYSLDEGYFAGRGADNAPLHALADGVSGVNGVYVYGASKFPKNGWNSSNYWVDVVFSTTGSVDTTAPSVTVFTVPATSAVLTVPISNLAAADNVAVTAYLVNESSSAPSSTASGWTAMPPTTYTFGSAGSKTLYAWAKDAAGNVSASRSAPVVITLADATAPVVTAFAIPATASTLAVPISTFAASDNVGVTGYLANESSSTPSSTASGWAAMPPTTYTFGSAGSKTLYAWAKDAAGNVSASRNATVTITIPTAGPEPAGWYAGDMHVHRSCGGAPESVASMQQKMGTNSLAAISLLADMGNGEVQNASTDLPCVGPLDDPVSTPGRTVHWDAEWHWDATYFQYGHQALGGHILALGLNSALQLWEEYTYPVLQWAHQQNGIAGFAHMQYLDDGIPQSLSCCTPIEYPVETALGASDFISEDVTGGEPAIHAYYRLLNTGFRPGLAAGTDYPCNSSAPLGSLLTYVRVAPDPWTYRKWIEGIAAGRTVIARTGHGEFLQLIVNGTAQPGDDIKLATGTSLPVTVQWTANVNTSGTIELVQNGTVVASKQASASKTAPATLTATLDFSKSGWVAARRMGNGEHQVHTAAVFVTVNNLPVRASQADAQFYVQWMDNLLARTSPGGDWSSYFPTNRSEAQARYRAAKAIFEKIASEALPPPPPPPADGLTIFTTQSPTTYEAGPPYELGTKVWSEANGQVTAVRLYTNASEGGTHAVRIWRAQDATLVAGPYTWSVGAGAEGWKTFTLPSAVAIAANTEYIVAVSNGPDGNYAELIHGFDSPLDNPPLHAEIGGGLYTESMGTMPTSTWENTIYFRDIVFVREP